MRKAALLNKLNSTLNKLHTLQKVCFHIALLDLPLRPISVICHAIQYRNSLRDILAQSQVWFTHIPLFDSLKSHKYTLVHTNTSLR